ncbi:biotin--[acetyl-CoA-carboxylase] ligase [Naasia lichenicola]|uniref:biotin--[biotin carboxyl-carrier protein] ligase n=1 Tax=Naasia lichenicola TaxID=2565933 RepID=A0A4S4FKD4_9MICO|nr:biotin--[acetyl-CoA-carboxylase] ligase [Naasia lichenicola]THG30850.1 biotin--[acetyl-CoA-carboxylase] ligase [Naasia lichenicola]
MQLPLSADIAARLWWLDESPSTNDDLLGRVRASGDDPLPSLSVVATDTQTAGRGRLGRVWTTPPRSALAASVLLRPRSPLDTWGWLPLIAGVAMTRAVTAAGARAELKWPNDVLIDGLKVSGILAELLPDASGVVVGSGVNLTLDERELPVPTATSLLIQGADTAIDPLLAAYLTELSALLGSFDAAGGDAERGGVHAAVRVACGTLGRSVRVILPSGEELVGEAADIDETGRLLVTNATTAQRLAVAAGDVTHLRYK